MRETQAFVLHYVPGKHHDRYAARGISSSCLMALIYGYREQQQQPEETTLSIRMLFDGRKNDHELKPTPMQEARVFLFRNVRQQKIEVMAKVEKQLSS